jgi:hypothetical protein
VCGGHIDARSLVAKVLWHGFYWPAMIDDAVKLVSTCEARQKNLSQDEGVGTNSATNSSAVALTEMGHRHNRKADSSARQLHFRSGSS